jgi:tetratricopeptide (TPR) repeat protein
VRIAREVGERNDEAFALDSLGLACQAVGRLDEARGHHLQALAIAQETGNLPVEVLALNALGEVDQAQGTTAAALRNHRAALAIAGRLGDEHQQARALLGIGTASYTAGDLEQARVCWTEAVTLFDELGLAERDDARRRLDQVR